MQVGELQKEEKGGRGGVGGRGETNTNLQQISERFQKKKLVFVCMFLSTLHTFRLCIPSNVHELNTSVCCCFTEVQSKVYTEV